MRRSIPLLLLVATACFPPAKAGSCTYDVDGDGVCDALDPCPLDVHDDSDGDGVCDVLDACAGEPDDVDRDADGVPDPCDRCPDDPEDDLDDDGLCADVDPCPELVPEDCTVPVVIAVQADVFPKDLSWTALDPDQSVVAQGTFVARGEGTFREVSVPPVGRSCVKLSDRGHDGGSRGLIFARSPDGKGVRLETWEFADSAELTEVCFDPSVGQRFVPPKQKDWLALGACDVQLEVRGGAKADEIGWTLQNAEGRDLGDHGEGYVSGDVDRRTLTLTDGSYKVQMTDAGGDGWGPSGITLRVGAEVIAEGTLADGADGWFDFWIDCG